MSESTAVEAPAAKEPFFKMSSVPGANILVPLLLGCLLNTLFPDLFKTLGSFTLGMTQQGAGPLVGAFLLIVGTTISFKSAPAAAARGAIIIAVKQIVVVAVSLLILYVFNDNLFGISAMVMLAACTGANNAMYAGLMGTMGNEAERGAVAITTLVVPSGHDDRARRCRSGSDRLVARGRHPADRRRHYSGQPLPEL